MDLFESLKNKISGKNIKIVFPEGNDERIVKAAVRLANDGMIKPIILGSKETVEDSNNGQALPESIEVIDPDKYPSEEFEKMVAAFVERRKGKNTEEQARKMLKDVNYFGTMMVYMGNADGLVSGAIHPTGDTVRPALQIIKTKPGVSRTSGAFIMSRGDERYYFADCAININPNAEELAEIAVQSAKSARLFDIDPRVALLSFSTMGSAKSDEVTKVQEATKFIPYEGDIDDNFKDIIGVSLRFHEPCQHIVFKAYPAIAPYIETKPIHHSQRIVERHEDYTIFSLDLVPNYEFESLMMTYADKCEILSPISLCKKLVEKAKNIVKFNCPK